MFLHSLATAVPPRSFSQLECWNALQGGGLLGALRPRSATLMERILTNGSAGIERRNFALEELGPVFSRDAQELSECFEREAPVLAEQAFSRALKRGGVDAGEVDALFVCTCTGYLCPGVSSHIAELIGLREDAYLAERTGVAPIGTQLFKTRDGRPILLKREVITTGDHIVDASSGIDTDSGSPAVFVTLDGQGAKKMLETTQTNVNKRMAVLFVETKVETRYVNGEEVRKKVRIEEVINDAVIRGVFGKRFQTTGLETNEARNLSLLLRAGALPAPIEIVEERTVGPSLGQDNIDQGRLAVIVGFLLVVVFMVVYYRVFGLVANMALMLNLVMIIAVLSLLQATLTLPGIAGIVLTVGMAVDANVLIFERIREELSANTPVQGAIRAGYEKALSSIADANITTLIAAVVLFSFGTGPIKGFAVTLSIGILTSMFTAIFGTRVVVNALYGRKQRLADLPI